MVHREDRDSVAILTMENGDKNVVDVDLFRDLLRRLNEVLDSNVIGVVLTGAGKEFVAGGNIPVIVAGGGAYVRELHRMANAVNKRLFTLPLPTVAAVNGSAISDGCAIAADCDWRVMTTRSDAGIGIIALLAGLPVPVSLLEVVHYLLPSHRVEEMMYTGRLYNATEALGIGLVNEVASPKSLIDRACERVHSLAEYPSQTFLHTKQQMRQATVDRIDRYSAEWDSRIVTIWSVPERLEYLLEFGKKLAAQTH
jgi:enoyl-CoA hydratase